MVRTIVIQLMLFLLPFLGYALYRLLLTDAREDGRKTWPINLLFAAGVALTLSGWTYKALNEDKSRDACYERARYVDGVLVPARTVPCERDITRVGEPATDAPGQPANGVADPIEPAPDEDGDE